jgi:hypothetical protein
MKSSTRGQGISCVGAFGAIQWCGNAERTGLIHQFIEGVGFRFRLRDMPNYWRECGGSVVDSHMF